MHGNTRMVIDPPIPTIPGRSIVGLSHRPGTTALNTVTPHLRTSVQVHVPLVVPGGPLGHLSTPENPHDVGSAVADEARLPGAVGVRPVEAPLVDRHFLEEYESGSEGLPGRCSRGRL